MTLQIAAGNIHRGIWPMSCFSFLGRWNGASVSFGCLGKQLRRFARGFPLRNERKPPQPPACISNEAFTRDPMAKFLNASATNYFLEELIERLVAGAYLEDRDGKLLNTEKGRNAGGEFKMSPKFGPYFLWPEDLAI